MTAMMAFFLVMWLVGQSKPVKAAIASYFRDPGAFDTKSGGDGILDGGKQAAAARRRPRLSADAEREALELSVSHIRERLDSVPELKTLRNQIEFTITDEGLRIDLLEVGAIQLLRQRQRRAAAGDRTHSRDHREGTRHARQLDHHRGHTDSHQYASADGYSNWELSADRANAARRVMQREGLRPTQVAAVRGHADRQLRVAADPFDPRNRRVSVIVKSLSK